MSTLGKLCQLDECCLVVIDPQERLAAAIPAKVVERMRRNVMLLLKAAGKLQVPVLATSQYPAGLGPWMPELSRLLPDGCVPIEKTQFSCAAAPEFLERLQTLGRRQVILCGMEAHVCVLQTAFELDDRGYACFIVCDATCSIARENYDNALSRIHQAGHAILSAESVLFEWLRDKEHPRFREIAQLLKERVR